METPTRENSEPMGNCKDSIVSDVSNDGNFEEKPEQNEGEIKGILEVIASTGKYWHCWDRLKSMLSLQLKQIIAKYPEAQMTTEQQNLSLGETCQELARRFDEALLCFDEGPPFTLQRLCEILLTARSIYPKLSKLAFALEKNLLVTSTLTAACNDPYPQTVMEIPEESDKVAEEHQDHWEQLNTVENGVEPPVAGDQDEVMTDVGEADNDIHDQMTIDMDALEEMVGSPEKNSTSTRDS